MPLRPVSELGLADATDVDARQALGLPAEELAAPKPRRPRARSRVEDLTSVAPVAAGATVQSPPRPQVLLADEPTIFVQAMLAGELHARLADAAHALAAEHWKLRKYKTILGALLWRYVRPDEPDAMRELGTALDSFLLTDVAQAPAEIKAGAHLPFSLKYSLDGAVLGLRRTRRAASAKTLLGTLIWRYVDPANVMTLAELLAQYDEISRPRPVPLG